MKLIKLLELTGIKNNSGVNKFKELTQGSKKSGIDDNRRQGLEAFKIWLNDNGFIALNTGSFGIVFTHQKLNYVIKLFKDDKPYKDFIVYCKSHQDNPHLPKIIGNLIKIDEHTFAIRLEKLVQPQSQEMYDFLEFLARFADTGIKPEKYIAQANNSIRTDAGKNSAEGYAYKLRATKISNSLTLLAKQPDILKTIYALEKSWFSRVSMDLHKGNMMVRPDGTVVIIDPWAQL